MTTSNPPQTIVETVLHLAYEPLGQFAKSNLEIFILALSLTLPLLYERVLTRPRGQHSDGFESVMTSKYVTSC